MFVCVNGDIKKSTAKAFRSKYYISALSFALLLSGCGGGGGDTVNPDTNTVADNTNTGVVTGADVAVTSLNAPSTANAGGSITVDFNVRNNGSEMATWFNAAVYLSYDSAITSGDDRSSASSLITQLNPGETTSVSKSITIPANLRSGTYHIGVKADSGGLLLESNETNNISLVSINITGTNCTVDGYEQNDSSTAAGIINLNTPQQHNHCDDDADWFMFSATANTTYSLTTSSLGAKADTRIEIYDTDGSTVLKSDSNSGLEDRASRLSWTAPTSDTYYVKVETPSGLEDTGPDTEYTLVLGDASSDLGVIDASFNGSSWLYAGGTRWVIFSPFNNGFASSGSFQVKAYMSTDNIIDQTDTLVGIYNVDDLAPAATTEFFNVDVAAPKNTVPGTYYLGFIADADNVVAEFNEQNNISNILQFEVVAVTACTLDVYEDDDFREFATIPTFGEVQQHNFCDDEKDWLMFNAIQGSSYVVKTVSQGGDANFSVYDPDDNYLGGGGQGSCCSSSGTFQFVAPSTGTYYVSVWSSMNNGGADSNYTVAVYDDLPDLTVDFLSYEGYIFYPGGVINIWTQTYNHGFEDAGPSETGLYLSTDATLDGSDIYIGSRPNGGITPFVRDEGWSLMAIPGTVAPGDYYLIAKADDTSQIMEIYEDNNTLALSGLLTISPTICAADAFEQDDLIQLAQPVSLGATQSRNFCDDGHDWMNVDLTQGQSVVFQENDYVTVNFELFDTDQETLLVNTSSNFLHWVAPAAGTYYVSAKGGYGTGTDYTLDVYGCDEDLYEDDNSRTVAPMIAIGESQSRNMCDGTIDTVAFNAVNGVTYTISTTGLGLNIDTELSLYDTVDAFFDIAWSDNKKPNTLESEIIWTAPADGIYYIVITGGGGRGAGTEYTISLQ